MKIHELIKILEEMKQYTDEVNVSCGGEEYSNDYPLPEVDVYEQDGKLVFYLPEESANAIYEEVAYNDLINDISQMGLDIIPLECDIRDQIVHNITKRLDLTPSIKDAKRAIIEQEYYKVMDQIKKEIKK